MDKQGWVILSIIVVLIVLVVLFWDKLLIKNEEIIRADYCELDSDCVLAINPSQCCLQPLALNKNVVSVDSDYVIYDMNFDSSDYTSKDDCSAVRCPNLSSSKNYNTICENNKCLFEFSVAEIPVT